MDILVKHETTDITSRVIQYDREDNICTGIGTLEIVLEGTYTTAINPHDTFSITEEGDFKKKYYVSDVDRNVPEGTVRVTCQDKSKYIVDYFIADQYTIDYPSYTRYWIEKFFTEAGISFTFTTDSQGNLLSNYTTLGLQPAYDQIVMLCQMSGWYFYFDGNGTAIIGSLTTDLSSGGSVGGTDILSIKKTIDDKMLRNRAVVWGSYDPIRHQYAYADVSVNTPYNYDTRDKRAIVISNNNIPTVNDAYSIANTLIKEFARPTITKEIEIWGARNYGLGETLRVTSRTWTGRGLITTFAVSMSRGGLITKVVLDERCPRLFGFFNFGDYVYVATWGDGVWRKHMRFDPSWYDFSDGLTDLHISDMHIDMGIFGSVDINGDMYYALYDLPWKPIPRPDYLMSSDVDSTASGVESALVAYSGVKARSTIIDKTTNTVKFALDTYSGLNTGDYFLYTAPFSGFLQTTSTLSGILSSGIVASGMHNRSWVLEYDPMTGELVDNEFFGQYTISYSGNYNMMVLDLENDGLNDYVSVAMFSGAVNDLIPYSGVGYNFGQHSVSPLLHSMIQDDRSLLGFDYTSTYEKEGESLSIAFGQLQSPIAVFENEAIGESEIVGRTVVSSTFRMRRTIFSKVFDPTLGATRVQTTTVTSATMPTFSGTSLHIEKISTDVYRMFTWTQQTGNNIGFIIKYLDWNANTNTFGTVTTSLNSSIPYDSDRNGNNNADYLLFYQGYSDNKGIHLFCIVFHRSNSSSSGGATISLPNYVEIYSCEASRTTGSGTAGLAYRVNFHTSLGNVGVGDWVIQPLGGWQPSQNIFKSTNGTGFAFFVMEADSRTSGTSYDTWLISSYDGSNFQLTNVQHATSNSDTSFLYGGNEIGSQLTGEQYYYGCRDSTSGLTYLFNGDSVTITTLAGSLPFQLDTTKIYVMTGTNDYRYIAKDGSDWWAINPHTLSPVNKIIFDTNYTISKPFSTTNSSLPIVFWYGVNNTTTKKEIVRSTFSAQLQPSLIPFSQPTFTQANGFICGNIFVDWSILGTGNTNALYIDNQNVPGPSVRFLVLQRTGEDYKLIEEEAYPIRIDISNYSPILAVGSGSASFVSSFVAGGEVTQFLALAQNNLEVRDYRYSLLQSDGTGDIAASGVAAKPTVLFVTGSGVFTGDASTYSGGFLLLDSSPAGLLERIETTNFTFPNEYIFITTSGDNPQFWQKDADKMFFTSYSGLPESRATIIRVDDYV